MPDRTKCLTIIVGVLVYCLLGEATKAADDFLALARPWVADELKLSDEQRARAKVRVRFFQAEMLSVANSYPLGGQDADGTRKRARLEKQLREASARTSAEIRDLLTEEQLERFQKMKLEPVLSDTVKFETRRSFAALLWPGDLQALKLTSGQQARLNAILIQATHDWRTGTGEADVRLQTLRDRVIQELSEILNPEQRQRLPIKGTLREPSMILLSHSQYDLLGSTAAFTKPGTLARDLASEVDTLKLIRVDDLTSMVRVGDKHGEPLKHVLWHRETERILAAASSPNSKFIVTIGGSVPGANVAAEIRLWDAKTGELLTLASPIHGLGSSSARTASVAFVTSECVLFNVSPFGR